MNRNSVLTHLAWSTLPLLSVYTLIAYTKVHGVFSAELIGTNCCPAQNSFSLFSICIPQGAERARIFKNATYFNFKMNFTLHWFALDRCVGNAQNSQRSEVFPIMGTPLLFAVTQVYFKKAFCHWNGMK